MKIRNIFCILAKTGAGKSFYYNKLIEDKQFMEKNNISTLVYGTTRKPRKDEIDGVDYYFYSREDYKKIPYDDLIEQRTYYTVNDGKITYFTKKEFFDNKDNVICITSPYQYDSYKNWCLKQNIIQTDVKYCLYLIYIDTNIKIRLKRLVDRGSTENDIYEACRRCIEEKSEFENVSKHVPEINDPKSLDNHTIYINNDSDKNEDIEENLSNIKSFIAVYTK